jgi:SulP family sulfate permease
VLVARPECRHLLFDFRSVIGVDSSAAHSFTQIKQALERHGARLVLVNLSPEMAHSFRALPASEKVIFGTNLDRALEACENAIIKAHQTQEGEAVSLRGWLADALRSLDYADILTNHCKRVEVAAGDIVARQGDVADSMHFILEGRVDIITNLDDARSVRVRSLGRYTSIGEMGLITARPRSATIQAAVPSVLYVLTAEAFDRIRDDNPLLGQALLTYVVDIMAERLSYASRAIGLLQR